MALDTERIQQLLAEYGETRGEQTCEMGIQLCQQALQDNPQDTEAICFLGLFHSYRGNNHIRTAAGLFEKAIMMNPTDDKLHGMLIRMRTQLIEDNRSAQFYKKWIDRNPEDIKGYQRLAQVYLRTGQLEEAQLVIDTGLKLDSKNVQLWISMGSLYAKKRLIDDALSCWKKALELDPTNASTVAQLGEEHAKLGQLDRALDFWQHARGIDPSLVSTRYSAVFLLEHAGRLEEAAEEWRQIISFNERNGWYTEAQWPRRELARIEKKMLGEETPY